MSDKVQLIKQEIEKQIDDAEDDTRYTESYREGLIAAYQTIKAFIDSLPEEPKKQPKYKVGDTIKGPCNNIFQVKEVLDKQYVLHSENGDELNSIEIVDANSCIVEEPSCDKKDYRKRYKRIAQTEQFKSSYYDKSLGKEEPISKDLDEELSLWMRENCDDNGFFNPLELASHFAEWQRKKDIKEMMKTLVEGEIVKDIHNQLKVTSEPLNDTFGKFGDKVKIIIIKEEQQ